LLVPTLDLFFSCSRCFQFCMFFDINYSFYSMHCSIFST